MDDLTLMKIFSEHINLKGSDVCRRSAKTTKPAAWKSLDVSVLPHRKTYQLGNGNVF